ncbi:MAG: serine/threonine-protein kinase [Polyangiaceae bacterium]
MGDAQPATSAFGGLPSVGDLISGKYEIVRVIAEGGMGLVYEAKHLQLDEPFAIKFLRLDAGATDSAEMAERFVREARMPMKIKSEHVVRVLDIGKHDTGAPFMVMEMLVGQDLDTFVEKHGVLPIAQGIDYVLQACEALAEAHMLGVVHRDLKPANLFLTYRADGTACIKVLDFGISKLKDVGQTGKDLSITKTHTVMGSPRYMSPEQMRSSRDVDARADVWAIGVVLYELFTAGVPFDGESMPQICAAILEEMPKSVRALRPDVPPELDAVILKCLEKKADDRYSNIAQLAHALAPFGSIEGRSSAERVGRVLRPSFVDFNTETVPRAMTIPPQSYPNISHASLLTPSVPLATTTGNAAKGVAWTDPNAPSQTQPKRKGGVFWGIALGLVLLLVGVGIMFKNSSLDQQAPPSTAALNAAASTNVAPEQPSAMPIETAPVAVAKPTEPPPDAAGGLAAVETEKVRAKTAGKKADAKSAAAKPTAHASATSGATAAAPAQTASADIWGDRK